MSALREEAFTAQAPPAPAGDPDAAWDGSYEVGLAGFWHIFFFGLFIPCAAIRGKRRLDKAKKLPPRKRYLVGVVVQQLVFAAFALFVAWREWIDLFPPFHPRALDLAAGALVLAALIAFMAPRWRRNVEKRVRRLWLFMPRDGVEKGLWTCVSICAGIGEEIVYRGVLYTLLGRLTGSYVLAAALCVAAFAVAHWVQGRSSALAIAGFAALFHGLVALSGALYVAMAVHVLYDLAAGFGYAYWGDRLGYPRTDEEFAALPADTPFAPQ